MKLSKNYTFKELLQLIPVCDNSELTTVRKVLIDNAKQYSTEEFRVLNNLQMSRYIFINDQRERQRAYQLEVELLTEKYTQS